MAYDPDDNPPRVAATIGVTGNPPTGFPAANQPAAYASSLWLYESDVDNALQCQAPGYFSNGGSLGMKVGDLVIVSSSVEGGGGVTLHAVTNVVAPVGNANSPGAATIGSKSGAVNSVAMGLVSMGPGPNWLPLTADVNVFSTTLAFTGAIIPTLNPGDGLIAFNGGAANLAIYPPTGGEINALGTDVAYLVDITTPFAEIKCVSPTQYIARQSA